MTHIHPSAEVLKSAPVGESRRENRKAVADHLDITSRIVEGFAGAGLTTKVWAASGAEVISIEIDRSTFEELKENVAPFPNVTPIYGNSKKIVPVYAEKNETFSVVDLDDNGNFLDLLEPTLHLLREGGYLSMTSTAYKQVMRNIQQKTFSQRFGDEILPLYEREHVLKEPEHNRRALADLISKTVEEKGQERGYTIETLCTEIGVVAISKVFAVNQKPPQSLKDSLTPYVYHGPRR